MDIHTIDTPHKTAGETRKAANGTRKAAGEARGAGTNSVTEAARGRPVRTGLRWSSLPQVPCCVLVVVPDAYARSGSFVRIVRRAHVRMEEINGDQKTVHILLDAASPRQMGMVLKEMADSSISYELREVALRVSPASSLQDLQALATWSDMLVSALGKRYALERRARRGKPPAGARYLPWSADAIYDQVYGGAMLLPKTWVRALARLQPRKRTS